MDSPIMMEYLAVVRKRLWLILLMLGLTLAVVIVRSAVAKPMYSTSVLLLVTVPERDDVTMFGQYSSRSLRDEVTGAKNNFIDMLKSETVAWRTIRSLGLQVAASDLIGNLSVETPAGTDFIVVSLKASSPDEAQRIVNAHVENTLKYVGALRSRPSAAVREFVSKQLDSTARELDSTNRALRDFRTRNDIGDLGEQVKSRQALISSLYLEREKAFAAGNTSQAAAYDSAIKQREQEVRSLSALSPEHETMQARIAQLEETYRFLLTKEAEATMKEEQASAVGHVQIVEWAGKPEQATSQRTATFAAMGGIASIVAGVMLILLWEYGGAVLAQGNLSPRREMGARLRRAPRLDEG